MTLLAPAALIGILLLAIPILVHLFKPRKMRRTPFSSLRWLKQTHQRLSRRIQWHQWLLFLLRAGTIALLVLALAKPLIGSRAGGRAADRFLVVDVGRTMGYDAGGSPTPLAQAQEIAERLVEHGRPGDRTALLLAGSVPRILTGPSADAGAHLPGVRAAQPQQADLPLSTVLPLIRSLTSPGDEHDLELVFLTDNRRRSWRQDDIQAFLKDAPGKVRVQVIDAGPGAVQNGWIAGAELIDLGPSEGKLLRAELTCVGEPRQERTLRLRGLGDTAEQAIAVVLTPGQITRADFKIPASIDVTGLTADLRLEPADALPSDDRWFVNLDMPFAQRVLLIEPADAEPGRGAGLYIRAGLEALGESNNLAFKIVDRTSKSVAPGDVQQAELVFLAGVPDLPGAVLDTLEQRVRGGAGAIVFLGDAMNGPFYREKLHRPLQPADGLLPLASGAPESGKTDGPGLLTGLSFSHPLFALLQDPVLSDIRQVRFRRHVAWTGKLQPDDAVLARIDSGEPALLDRPLGAGRVLVWNASADDSWSDLPRRRAFVPLLHRMIGYVAGGARQREFTAGERVVVSLADATADETVSVTGPDGAKVPHRLVKAGGQTLLQFDRLDQAGVYQLERGGKTTPFTVNASRAGSALTPMDAKTLQAWWAPATVEVIASEAALQEAGQVNVWPLWPALIFLAGLLLLAETIYVYRLCPRSDPAVVEAIVPQRTVLRPLQKDSV